MKTFLLLSVSYGNCFLNYWDDNSCIVAQDCKFHKYDEDLTAVCDGKTVSPGGTIKNGANCQFACAVEDEIMEGDANATCDSGNIVRPFCRCEKCCSKDYRYIDGIR